jgi:hypothetical protein
MAHTLGQFNARLTLHAPFPLLFCHVYWGNMVVALGSKYICSHLHWMYIQILRIHHLEPITTPCNMYNCKALPLTCCLDHIKADYR